MKTRLMVAAALALLMSGGAAMAAEGPGLINSGRQLKCKVRIDAENLALSKTPAGVSFSDYLSELVLSGRCEWTAKGTKVLISEPTGNGGETLAVRLLG